MTETFLRRTWNRVASWVQANAEHITVRFIADETGRPIHPHAGYVRLWLAEGFIARQRSWGVDRFPALHGGVSLSLLGGDRATFTSFSRPPEAWAVPGAQLDFPLTALLPFTGGVVEIEAALYEARTGSPLGTAVDVVSSLASLLGPPLSTAAVVAEKISDGLDVVLSASGVQPVLALHTAMVAPGGGGTAVRAGHVVVLAASPGELRGEPVIHDGRLHLHDGSAPSLPTGVDYLVVRVECRQDRDDWRFPELDALIRAAGEAFIHGHHDAYADMRTDAIARAWNSTDLTSVDRRRVALLVRDELDRLAELGVVPGPERALDDIAEQRLPDPGDPRLRGLTLDRLVSG